MLERSRNTLCLAILLFSSGSPATETEIDVSEIPDVVMRKINTEYPGIEVLQAVVLVENDTTVYELEVVIDDREYELDVTAEGKVVTNDGEINYTCLSFHEDF